MNNKDIEHLRIRIKEALQTDEMRYRHTLGVANTAACLAMRYETDMEQAYIAGLLHDCAKCIPNNEKIAQCRKYNLPISDSESQEPSLLHAKLGAYYAKAIYNIEDENIYNAIYYHTTGRSNMTILEKIIFLADYIEPYRNKAANLEYIRRISFENMDHAVYEVTKDTLDYLRNRQISIDPMTAETNQFYADLLEF